MTTEKEDKRITERYLSVKDFLIIFFVLAAFNGFHMWIYKALEDSHIFETNVRLGINLLMVFVLFSALVVIFLVVLVGYRRFAMPMNKLREAARKITEGDLTARVEHLRKDGKKGLIEVLFDDFNTMADELSHINANLHTLVYEKTKKVINLQNAMLTTMSNLVEFRDHNTGGHITRIQDKVKLIVQEIRKQGIYSELTQDWDIYLIVQSASLHDIGKIAISDQILRKQDRLTDEEYEEIKQHATLGLQIIERIEIDSGESDFLNHAKIFAYTHHEKWDGTGYPNGLKGEEIPLQGRIMAIADVYDAITSERSYKKALPHEEAMRVIVEGKGTHFDPVLVDVFCKISEKF